MATIRSSITVSIPSEIKQRAIDLGILFSRTLEDALVERIKDLERAMLAGEPVPGYHPTSWEVSSY